MKNEKSWKLGCGGRITVRENPNYVTSEGTPCSPPSFNVRIYLAADSTGADYSFYMHKSKATIQAIRRMCNWMEKRL